MLRFSTLRRPLVRSGRRLHSSATAPAFTLNNHYHDFIRYPLTEGRSGRIQLRPPKVVGSAVSRGTRPYQEDAHTISAIHIRPVELQHSIQRYYGFSWDPGHIGESLAGQVLFCGVYDGHGGPFVSQYLQNELHGLFETADPREIPTLVQGLKEVGGYFKRFKGGVLLDWITPTEPPRTLDLEARATLAFLEADRRLTHLPGAENSGATASVALLHSIDPYAPFFLSEDVALTVAHCGDTRVLLCASDGGVPYPMTEEHHADTRGEQARLRKMGQGIVTDSFGEARYMGALANTRGFGDSSYKYFGMTPEPEVRTRRLTGKDWAFMVLLSDGVSSVLSDDEIVDLARHSRDPQHAARSIISFAEEIGMDDNASVIVIPLSGWGHVKGPDRTKEIRDYKRAQAEASAKAKRSNR
ncbi:hypothetical protein FRC03_012420 [Tulasnella sp. 419]|nr:hypothetical protein FRC03_012420 [Tulasnella sp. 419]